MGTHHGHTTLDPETTITVDDAEHTDLVRWGVWVDAEPGAAKAKGETKGRKRVRNRSRVVEAPAEAKDEGAGEASEPEANAGDVVAEDEGQAQEATE